MKFLSDSTVARQDTLNMMSINLLHRSIVPMKYGLELSLKNYYMKELILYLFITRPDRLSIYHITVYTIYINYIV